MNHQPRTNRPLTNANGLGLILAGGKSLRLFPIDFPKPLLKVQGKSLLEGALNRLKGLKTHVVCSASIRKSIEGDMKSKKPHFIVEPEPRDTAGAVGFALRTIAASPSLKKYQWMAIISADHYFPHAGFHRVVDTVRGEIEKYPHSLFVLGSPQSFKPKETHSQFGWIVPAEGAASASREVARFVEKPTAEVLENLYSEEALINGGMFFGRIDIFREAFEKYFPEAVNPKFSFKKLHKQPIDRAIFEKFDKVRVVNLDLAWEDLGTWADWARLGLQDETQEVNLKESRDAFVWTDDDSEVSVFGMENVAVIKAGKRILVMPLSQTPQLKTYL